MKRIAKHIVETVRRSMLLRRVIITVWHVIGICLTYYLAFFLRFEGQIPFGQHVVLWETLPLLLAVCLAVFAVFRLYSGLWSYFSIDDLGRMFAALASALALFAVAIFSLGGWSFVGYPRSVFILEFMMLGGWMGGGRCALRCMRQGKERDNYRPGKEHERILVVGRLQDADLVIRGARHQGMGKFVGIVTDDCREQNLALHGIRISGPIERIRHIAEKARASCILVLPPFNRPGRINDIVNRCVDSDYPIAFRMIPSMADLASGELSVSSIRNVDIEDLISRGSANLDRTEVRRFVKNKRVMITGAGGSIGSELCRQIAGYEPEILVLFEASEFALYSIERDIRLRYPNLRLIAYAGDIRHSEEVEDAIERAGGIDIIYHSAAYKHVPLMEANVSACFRTNVLGTARLAKVAADRQVDRFVLISSDKAVRPTSIMGASKRIAERIMAEMPPSKTTFVSVRFGNVLESSGSVVPLFKQQIAKGGPVTVTSPDVRRFFMTVSEAVDLVLLAGTVGRNGEIMVLEMGESVSIYDLARRLIELSGFVPEKDIKIEFTGLRPGEKGYEEVMTDDENVVRTSHEKIWVLRQNGPERSRRSQQIDLERIEKLVLKNDGKGIRRVAVDYVPENRFAVKACEGASK